MSAPHNTSPNRKLSPRSPGYCADVVQWLRFSALPRWLTCAQPAVVQERPAWWAALLDRLGQTAGSSSLTLDMATRFICVVEHAVASGALADDEGLVRLGGLAHTLADHAPDWSVPPALQPDVIAGRCLELIEFAPADIRVLAVNWRDLPPQTMAGVVRTRHLIDVLQNMVVHVQDLEVTLQARDWIDILPLLY